MIREQSELECPENLTNFGDVMGWKYAYRLIIIAIMIDVLTHILKRVYLTKQASILLKYTKPCSVKR